MHSKIYKNLNKSNQNCKINNFINDTLVRIIQNFFFFEIRFALFDSKILFEIKSEKLEQEIGFTKFKTATKFR